VNFPPRRPPSERAQVLKSLVEKALGWGHRALVEALSHFRVTFCVATKAFVG
jgi:hypothetical protein